MPLAPTLLLFSYGTLQNRNVQIANFGRELNGVLDVLPGYTRRTVLLTDANVINLSGESEYFTVEPSTDPSNTVKGTVFEVTESEMAAADQYEKGAGYRRVQVTLASGRVAWVYFQG